MKPFIDKFFAETSRFEVFLLIIPFICWFFCFFNFFTGHLYLEADAISYADHIGFYTNNLSKGVFPLWDPAWFSGTPYHFFLRRIGDVNPLLFLIVLLKWAGVPSATAYLIFLGVYYFLAGWAFYLITRFLLVDRFFAFTAYILFIFSSWGSEIFYNYIIIIFLPIIWFFYFLLRFFVQPHKWSFLGACFCVGLVVTTYIPFFFLTILAIFMVLYILFYGGQLFGFLKRGFTFFHKNKVFTGFCIIFLLSSCVPALVFYKESKSGDFVLPNRHAGADVSSAVAVGLENAASGDIISHGYFDRIFDDHAHMDMGDIYIPYIFFLALVSTVCARANKLIFFLLFNILGLSLITVTSAAGVHRFLYDHIIFFKFMRNLYYFFWLAMLPMGILLAVAAFKSLLAAINSSSAKRAWLVYIIICHLVFALFLCTRQGVLWGAWAAILISMFYFFVYFFYESKISYLAGFFLFFLAVFFQSAQVYGFLDKKLFQMQQDGTRLDHMHQSPKKTKLDLYYASSWFAVLVNYIDPQVLDDYREHQFMFYDNVIPYRDSPEFFKTLQTAMAGNANIAFISNSESGPADWKGNPYGGGQAGIDPIASGELSVLAADANTWVLKAHLSNSRFLVINDNYHGDWHAFINSRKARLLRANFSFKGLWVPAGGSKIVLRFSSPKRYALHFGLIAFFAGTFWYLIVLLIKKKNKQDLMHKSNVSFAGTAQWICSRVAVIYVLVFLFCFTCMDLKMLEMRVKVRHLNDAIPDFSDMIIFSKEQNAKNHLDWRPYKDYFELILRYLPDDLITRQLLGYVDFYMGQEQKAIALFKDSAVMKGQNLFWSNYNLGVIYYKNGMWSQAAEYLFKAISSNFRLTLALMQDSLIYRQILANQYFKYSLSDEIEDAQSRAYILLLSSLHHMGRYDKIIVVSGLGLANPNLSYKDAFYYYEGLAFLGMGQIKNAFLLFQKSLTIEKNNPDVYYYIADIYQKAGQLEQARDLLQVSYALHQKNDPRFPYEAQANLRFF